MCTSQIDEGREAAEAWVRSLDLPDELVKRVVGKGRGEMVSRLDAEAS